MFSSGKRATLTAQLSPPKCKMSKAGFGIQHTDKRQLPLVLILKLNTVQNRKISNPITLNLMMYAAISTPTLCTKSPKACTNAALTARLSCPWLCLHPEPVVGEFEGREWEWEW